MGYKHKTIKKNKRFEIGTIAHSVVGHFFESGKGYILMKVNENLNANLPFR